MNKTLNKRLLFLKNSLPSLGAYEAELAGDHRRKTVTLRGVGQIKHFSEEELRIVSGRETVVLQGKRLGCRIYANRAVCIEGEILRICFEKE